MNLFTEFRQRVVEICAGLDMVPADTDFSRVSVDPPRDVSHGDISTNAAMVLAKAAAAKPRDLAGPIAEALAALDGVVEADVAGPGFVNARLAPEFWQARLAEVLRAGTAYGQSDAGGGQAVNVEYISANPTGPLHVAHARGAVVGDVLARLLAKAGFAVTSEYYINDAGAQVEALARSAHLRYRQALGEDIGDIPEGLYPGDYMVPIGEALAEQEGEQWRSADEDLWLERFRAFAVEAMMARVREDLAALGVEQEVFASERALVENGAVQRVFENLSARDLIYTGVLEPPKGKAAPEDWEPRPQTLFRATDFGDDVDRPLKKSDGTWTYFANDIAYHLDKYERGFADMVDVLGADHGGYVKRMQAAVAAVTEGEARFDAMLCQMVHLKKGGEPMRMSKRAGNFVTLRDLIDEVGKDVVRFMMLTRKNDSQMEFDLDKALEQSRDNPVFYVQYAHARCRSVLRNAAEDFDTEALAPEALAGADMSVLADPAELELIRMMASWPRTVEGAAETREPHRVAFYLYDLASLFHALWNKGKDDARLRFIDPEDLQATLARLAMVQGVATVVASGLDVMGVEPVEELR